MIKKIVAIFALTLAVLGMRAQLPVGAWTMHSPFNGVDKIVETKSKTFYLSSGTLFSIDKNTDETRTLNLANDLNGGQVSRIFGQPEGKYIIVVYRDNNMDRINDDGTVVNISDISDALLPGTPTINHVGFGKDRFYVAASFGLVTFDAKRNETVETMFTPKAVSCVAVLGDHVVINYDTKWRAAKASDHLVSLDKFSDFNNKTWDYIINLKELFPLSDTRLVFPSASSSNNRIVVLDFDWDKNEMYATEFSVNGSKLNMTQFTHVGTDKMFAVNGSNKYLFDATCGANAPTVSPLPGVLSGQTLSAYEGLDNVWAGNAQGMSKYDITDPSSPVQLIDKFGKTEFATQNCNYILPQRSGNLIFFDCSNQGQAVLGFTHSTPLLLTRFSEGKFTDITPTDYTLNGTNVGQSKQQMMVVEDPLDPDAVFVSDNSVGVYRFKNGAITHLLTKTNSPILKPSVNYFVFGLVIDDNNWLWISQEQGTRDTHIVGVPVSAFQSGTEVPASAFVSLDPPGRHGRVSRSTFLKKTNMVLFGGGNYNKNLNFLPVKNPAQVTNDSFVNTSSYIDQDNKTLSFNHIVSFCEDKEGRVWVGTDQGVFEITDPSKVTAGSTKVNHIKVPRNDGTGLADYLLDAVQVNSIAVDSSNRKWLATKTDGVYLVSPDGDRIIEHYTSSNSMLPSDNVYSVACDPNSSSIFFATDNGVVEYNSTSAPASETLDNVYAFPNPVRPEYSGWITVTGLMDNTLVKIADSAGNVFYQGRSEGGMITWDGCNAAGDRVKTGVYYVLASVGTSGGATSDSCVTKIMVIN